MLKTFQTNLFLLKTFKHGISSFLNLYLNFPPHFFHFKALRRVKIDQILNFKCDYLTTIKNLRKNDIEVVVNSGLTVHSNSH